MKSNPREELKAAEGNVRVTVKPGGFLIYLGRYLYLNLDLARFPLAVWIYFSYLLLYISLPPSVIPPLS